MDQWEIKMPSNQDTKPRKKFYGSIIVTLSYSLITKHKYIEGWQNRILGEFSKTTIWLNLVFRYPGLSNAQRKKKVPDWSNLFKKKKKPKSPTKFQALFFSCIPTTFFHESRVDISPHHRPTFSLEVKSSPLSVALTKYCALGRCERSAKENSSPAKNWVSPSLFSYTSSTLDSLSSFCLIATWSCLIFIRGANASWNTKAELGGLKLCPSASSHWSMDAFASGFVPYSPLFPWSACFSQMYRHIARDSELITHKKIVTCGFTFYNGGPNWMKMTKLWLYLPKREMPSSSNAGTWPKGCWNKTVWERRVSDLLP